MLGTFLPPPHCDGVFRLHPHRQQQLPCSAEVNVANAFSVRTPQDGQCLLGHGVPHVDGWGEACKERPNRRNHTTSQPQNRGRKYQDLNIQGPVDHRTETKQHVGSTAELLSILQGTGEKGNLRSTASTNKGTDLAGSGAMKGNEPRNEGW